MSVLAVSQAVTVNCWNGQEVVVMAGLVQSAEVVVARISVGYVSETHGDDLLALSGEGLLSYASVSFHLYLNDLGHGNCPKRLGT